MTARHDRVDDGVLAARLRQGRPDRADRLIYRNVYTNTSVIGSLVLQGRLSPLRPWSKVPAPHLPFPLPLPLPSPLFPLHSLPLPLEVGPLIAARGSGGAL